MIRKALRILDVKQQLGLLYLLMGTFFLAVLEMVSIIILAPIIKIINGDLEANFFKSDLMDGFNFPHKEIFIALLIFCLYVVGKNIVTYYFQKKLSRTIFKLKASVSDKLFYEYLKKDYLFYLKNNSADLINNIINVTSIFSQHFIMGMLNLITDSLVVFLILGYFFYIQPLGMLVASIFLGAILFLININVKNVLGEVGLKRKRYDTEALKSLQQSFSAIKEVKIFNAGNYFLSKYSSSNRALTEVEALIHIYQSLPKLWFECIGLLTLSILLMVAIHSGSQHHEVMILLAVFGAGAFKLIPALSRIIGSVQLVRSSNYAVEIIFETFFDDKNRCKPIDIAGNGNEVIFNDLRIQGVTFTYPTTHKTVIENFSATIKRGEVIGLMAPSGSGKSTLVTLLMGLLKPASGQILVNGTDIKSCQNEWRNIIGYVPQNIYLSDETVIENIIFSGESKNPNEEALEYALRISKVADITKNLPQGLNTKLGDFGTRLSGGQKQRIAIARALYRKPQLLILDEATTGLDEKVETDIFLELASIKDRVTIIVISHNKTVLSKCDRVIGL